MITTSPSYAVRAVSGETPEELWLGVQQRMGELEREVTVGLAPADLVVVDGPTHRPRSTCAVRSGW